MSTTTGLGLGWSAVHDSDPRGSKVELRGPGGERMEVPYIILEEFVGGVCRDREIATLEQQSGRDWLASRKA